ncbi:MAG: hypothetical protein WAK55_05785 [Xanthobacteraceae bacterium]
MTLALALQWIAYLTLIGIVVIAYYTARSAMADPNWRGDQG